MNRAAIALVSVVSILACANGSAPGPLPGEDCMGGVVAVTPPVAEIAVGDSVLAVARRRSFIESCFPGAGTSFAWQPQRPELVEVTVVNDSSAYLKGIGSGSFLVFATLGGGAPPGPLSAYFEMRVRVP